MGTHKINLKPEQITDWNQSKVPWVERKENISVSQNRENQQKMKRKGEVANMNNKTMQRINVQTYLG